MRKVVTILALLAAAPSAALADASGMQVWKYYERITAGDPWTLYGEHRHDHFYLEKTVKKGINSSCTATRFKDIYALKAVGPDGKTIELDCMERRRARWPEDFDATGKRVVSGWQ